MSTESSLDTRVANYYADNFIRLDSSLGLVSVTNPRDDIIIVHSSCLCMQIQDKSISDCQIYTKPNYKFPNGMISDATVTTFRSRQINAIREILQVHSSPRRILTNFVFLLFTVLLLLLFWRQLQSSSD